MNEEQTELLQNYTQCKNTTHMYNVEFSSSWGCLKVSGENTKNI